MKKELIHKALSYISSDCIPFDDVEKIMIELKNENITFAPYFFYDDWPASWILELIDDFVAMGGKDDR